MDHIVRKLKSADQSDRTGTPGSSLRETQSRELRLSVTAESLENMQKRAVVTLEAPIGSTYEIVCDEGAYLGGDDEAPPPLSYFSAAVAF